MPAPHPTIIATSIGFQPDGADQPNIQHGQPARALAPARPRHCTARGVHRTDLFECITETPGALAYEITRDGDTARERPLPTRQL